jgi:hypothetical protein
MSIVPKEVVASIAAAWNLECGETFAAHIANRAAQWALEQALGKLADEYVDAEATLAPEDRAYNAAVGHCEDAIRALMKGGESDGQ